MTISCQPQPVARPTKVLAHGGDESHPACKWNEILDRFKRWCLALKILIVVKKQMQPTFKSWHRPGLGGVIFFVLVYHSLKVRMFSLDNLNHFLVRHHLQTKPSRNKKSINLSLCDVLMTQDRQEVSVHLWYLISLFSHYLPPLGQI